MHIIDFFAIFFRPLHIHGTVMAVADHLKNDQYLKIYSDLFRRWDQWGRDCATTNLSMGTCLVVMGAGTGTATATSMLLGPFRTQ